MCLGSRSAPGARKRHRVTKGNEASQAVTWYWQDRRARLKEKKLLRRGKWEINS